MTAQPPEANASLVALACEKCGGSYDFRALEATAVCPYCQHVQALPPELLAQVASYSANVDTERERAQLQALIATRYAAMQPAAWLGMAIWAGMTLTMISLLGVLFLGRAGGFTVGGMFSLGGILAVLGASAGLSVVRDRRNGAKEAASSFESKCPGCGGSNHLAIGQTLASCEYCGVALVPGERLAAIGLGLAAAQTRASRLNAVAASRQFRIAGDRRNRLLRKMTAVVSPVFPAMITVYSYQQYKLGLGEWSQVMASLVFTLILLFAPFGIYVFRQITERPIRSVMSVMASAPGSTPLAGVEGTVAWLNGLWLDEFGEYYDLQPSARYRALALVRRGFPVLLVICPGRYLHIAVAAEGVMPERAPALLRELNFQTKACPSGVLASLRGVPLASLGDPGEEQRLDRCIDALIEEITKKGGRPAARC
jgi:hypothetical protein